MNLKERLAVWEQRGRHLEVVENQTPVNNIMTCHDNVMISNDSNKIMLCHNMNHNMVSKKEYVEIVSQLEKWGVFYPKKVVKDYSPLKVKEAIERTKFSNPRVPGAYFKSIIKNMM